MVYSTCSLNPLEDEAVVATVIENVGGVDAMEIVPLPDCLVNKSKALPGLTSWQVPHPKFGKNGDDNLTMYQSFDYVPIEHQGGKGEKVKKKKGTGQIFRSINRKGTGQIFRSMFPPTTNDSSLTNQLKNCGRFVPNDGLDSGGFFVACIRRLKAGELTIEVKDNEPKAGDVEEVTVANATKSEDIASSAKSSITPNLNAEDGEKELRVGDWTCLSCSKVNFGWRQGFRCFNCKSRKPREDKKELDSQKKKEERKNPLLLQPDGQILDTFFCYFGIKRDSFPLLDNTRLILRKKGEVTDIVVVSNALSKLAISNNWAPVRELGTSIASFSNEGEALKLFDEGLYITAKYANKRHIKLPPAAFLNALAQSVRQLLSSTAEAEAGRVKGTLDRSDVLVESLCENNMWYDTLDDQMISAFSNEPGYIIVSCDIYNCLTSFCVSIDSKGSVIAQTSLRIVAALLVVVHKYVKVTVGSDCTITKRRRMNDVQN